VLVTNVTNVTITVYP